MNMLIKVYKSFFKKLKNTFVNNTKLNESLTTNYPQNENVCNSLKNNKLKASNSGYYHIHNTYDNY